MKWKQNFLVMIACILIAAVFTGVEYWNRGEDIQFVQLTDTLVGLTDSTATFPWSARFMVTVGPGYNDTSYFSKAGGTRMADSNMVKFWLRGWTTKTRTQLMFMTPLWGSDRPFNAVTRPKSLLAIAWGSGGQTAIDSCTRIVLTDRSTLTVAQFAALGAAAAGTGIVQSAVDSLRLASIALVNATISEFAPWYDIVKSDSVGKAGYNHRAKVTVTGFPVK